MATQFAGSYVVRAYLHASLVLVADHRDQGIVGTLIAYPPANLIAEFLGRAADGPITERSSTGSSSGSGPTSPGVTCRPGTGTGRPSTTGIAAGRWMEPGRRSWTGCALDAMRPRGRTGRRVWIPLWRALISMPPELVVSRPPTSRQRGRRRSQTGHGPGGAGPLTGRVEHEDSPGRRPALPADRPDHQPRSVRR
ncbi:hypothetical protein H4W81_002597 [Nonomuraea africana]|uniref:Uncharacterized protein n=1 Tax=Nonomuraea africana TaxID=46171 RepID=A0ABR9KCU1_9ACTN|nr:hypothetical protein [Nonomuraea africana]